MILVGNCWGIWNELTTKAIKWYNNDNKSNINEYLRSLSTDSSKMFETFPIKIDLLVLELSKEQLLILMDTELIKRKKAYSERERENTTMPKVGTLALSTSFKALTLWHFVIEAHVLDTITFITGHDPINFTASAQGVLLPLSKETVYWLELPANLTKLYSCTPFIYLWPIKTICDLLLDTFQLKCFSYLFVTSGFVTALFIFLIRINYITFLDIVIH